MRNAFKVLWLVMISLLATSGANFGAGLPARTINLPQGGASAIADDDDEKPDVTARVARISFIRGDVKIKRIGNDEWEKAVLNLPLIEGDEISTGSDARLELQFNNYVHIRLDHDAYLKFAVMKDEGVALSLSQGTMNVRITDLDKAGGYFEVDAPKTTVAVEKSGSYRIDAARPGDSELHVSVTNGGSARVYSENAGFTLKSGRGARVFIDGENAGEWETAEAAKFDDEFDAWAADRDSTIAKRMAAAYYDKYYDQDIYGADDLNDYGEWVYTSSYGYVWRPNASSINVYADWSPYRYGHWRWLGPYGWTWVNDEPWGWATYHHGRWIYDHGSWVWCPYGFYRPKHSWWFPALVTINIINDNVCWYPLSYRHHWHNYNDHHNGGGWGGNGGGGHVVDPHGTGRDPRHPGVLVRQPGSGKATGVAVASGDTDNAVPLKGVVAVSTRDFGTKVGGVRVVSEAVAKEALSADSTGRLTVLPDRKDVAGRIDRDIIASRPADRQIASSTKLGAADRHDGAALDTELRAKRIYNDRQPVKVTNEDGSATTERRRPGAVDRPERPTYVRPVDDKKPDTIDAKPVDRRPRPEKVERDPIEIRPPLHVEKPEPNNERPRGEPRREEPKQPPHRDPPPREKPVDVKPSKPESKPAEKPTVTPRKADPTDGL